MVTVDYMTRFMNETLYSGHVRFPSAVEESCEWAHQRKINSIKRVVDKVIKIITDSDPSVCFLTTPKSFYCKNGTLGSHRGSGIMPSTIRYNGRME